MCQNCEKRKRENADSQGSADSSSQQKRPRVSYSDTVTVRVSNGEAERDFMVHKAILVNKSPYMEAACSERWEEGRKGFIPVTDTDPKSFEVVLHWIYTGELNFTFLDKPEPSLLDYCRIWSLANYLQVALLPDIIITAAIRSSDKAGKAPVEFKDLHEIWELTGEDTTFRRLTVAMLSYIKGTNLVAEMESFPVDLLKEFATYYLLRKQKPTKRPTYGERCEYHEHAQDEKCRA